MDGIVCTLGLDRLEPFMLLETAYNYVIEPAKTGLICTSNFMTEDTTQPVVQLYVYVTGFAKRGLIHASNFATLMIYNFVCD